MTYKEDIFVDIDGTTLDLMGILLEIYNIDYNDNLTPNDITEWEFANLVKPEAKDKVYGYFDDPSLYWAMQPLPFAVEGISFLKSLGYRIIFATHSTMGASGAKYKRLKELGLIEKQDDYIEAKDKSLLFGDYLIDDGIHNIKVFKSGIPILFSQKWNEKEVYSPRVNGWKEVMNYFEIMEERL